MRHELPLACLQKPDIGDVVPQADNSLMMTH